MKYAQVQILVLPVLFTTGFIPPFENENLYFPVLDVLDILLAPFFFLWLGPGQQSRPSLWSVPRTCQLMSQVLHQAQDIAFMCILGQVPPACIMKEQNKTYPKFKDLDPAFSSASDIVKMIIFSQLQFLSKICKPERFIELK